MNTVSTRNRQTWERSFWRIVKNVIIYSEKPTVLTESFILEKMYRGGFLIYC